jgi:hypothetical protein
LIADSRPGRSWVPRLPALACGCALLAGCASSGLPGQPAGSPVRLGASVAEVRRALNTSAEPARGAPPAAELDLQLDARGVQVLFDRADLVRTVRLRAPYPEPVLGVRIGDGIERLLAKLGAPYTKTVASGQTGYTYHPDGITILTYMVNPDNRVEAIFVVR